MSDLVSNLAGVFGGKKGDAVGPMPALPDPADSPEYARLTVRMNELGRRRAAAEARLGEIAGAIDGASDVGTTARRLLDAATLPADVGGVADYQSLQSEAARVQADLRVLDAALDEGRAALDVLRVKAIRAGGADVRAWHRKVIVAQARHLCEAAALGRAESEAIDRAAAAGDMGLLAHARFGPCDALRLDDDSQLSWHLRGLIEQGVLAGDEAWLPAGAGRARGPRLAG